MLHFRLRELQLEPNSAQPDLERPRRKREYIEQIRHDCLAFRQSPTLQAARATAVARR
jgi:hypothetical protein